MSWTRADGTVRCNNLRQVFRYWRLERTSVSLLVRRLRWYQNWSRHPWERGAVVAAVFETSRLDAAQGIQRLEGQGFVGPSSTPWAQ
eukprot:6438708-Pyramimonas_sp.AAC.1